MATSKFVPKIKASLEKELIGLKGQSDVERLSKEGPMIAGRARDMPPKPVPSVAGTAVTISEDLGQKIQQLEQIKRMLDEDKYFAVWLDSVIGQQVKDSEKRLRRTSIMLNVLLLLAGWGLSVFGSPSLIISLLHSPH